MRKFFSLFIVITFCLLAVSSFYPGLVLVDGLKGALTTAFWYSLLTVFIKPFLKIIYIPLNLLSFGLAKYTLNIILFLLVIYFSGQIKAVGFLFAGFSNQLFTVPEINFNPLMSLILGLILLEAVKKILLAASDSLLICD